MADSHVSVPLGAGPQAGSLLEGRFQLIRPLGSGGMARVWEGRDLSLDRRVAIKVLHPHLMSDTGFVARFRQEAIAAARLTHPSIVSVYSTCSSPEYEAIVLELVEGTTLRRYLDQHRQLEAPLTVRIGVQVAEALAAAHAAGLVHRDIKPANILLCPEGRVKVADFGIAKLDDQTDLLAEGGLIGTAAYLEPERLQGHPYDGRADLYSLGVVLYECVAGRPPFIGDNAAAVAVSRLHQPPPDPRQFRPSIPGPLAEELLRVLSIDPARRHPDANAFRAALVRAVDVDGRFDVTGPPPPSIVPETVAATDENPTEQVPATVRERRWILPALTILLLGVAIVVATALLGRSLDSVTGNDAPDTVTTLPGATQLPLSVTTLDPQGDQTENDRLLGNLLDGAPGTGWRTEGYDAPTFFGDKTGVGLVLNLEASATLDRLSLNSPSRGWEAGVHVLDDVTRFDAAAAPTARVEMSESNRDDIRIDLGARRGRVVVVWFTSLAPDPQNAGRYRVEISDLGLTGRLEG